MYLIGLTGGLSSGKSSAAKMFRELGAKVIDADKIVHQLLSPHGRCFNKVVKLFGKEIVRAGRIDRKEVAQIVFAKPSMRKKLEEILHPQVRVEIKRKIQKHLQGKRTKILVLDIPLLFESHWHRQVDATVVISSSKTQQVSRALKNLKISKSEALRRISAQMPLPQKVLLADYVVKNNRTKLHMKKQIKKIYTEILIKHKGETKS